MLRYLLVSFRQRRSSAKPSYFIGGVILTSRVSCADPALSRPRRMSTPCRPVNAPPNVAYPTIESKGRTAMGASDKMEAAAEKAKGKAKEAFGDATDDD